MVYFVTFAIKIVGADFDAKKHYSAYFIFLSCSKLEASFLGISSMKTGEKAKEYLYTKSNFVYMYTVLAAKMTKCTLPWL